MYNKLNSALKQNQEMRQKLNTMQKQHESVLNEKDEEISQMDMKLAV